MLEFYEIEYVFGGKSNNGKSNNGKLNKNAPKKVKNDNNTPSKPSSEEKNKFKWSVEKTNKQKEKVTIELSHEKGGANFGIEASYTKDNHSREFGFKAFGEYSW